MELTVGRSSREDLIGDKHEFPDGQRGHISSAACNCRPEIENDPVLFRRYIIHNSGFYRDEPHYGEYELD